MIRINEHDPERTVIEHANGFTMVNKRAFELGIEPYFIPSERVQVFYLEVPGKAGWSCIVRYDSRGRPVKYNLEEEDNVEEEGDSYQEKLVVADVFDEESDEEVDQYPNDIADDFVLGDDID